MASSSRVRAEVVGLLLAVVFGSAAHAAAYENDDELHELIAAVEPSVVTIEVPGVGAGSGFVVDADGIVATNFHVIAGATEVRVKFHDGSSVDAVGFVTISPGKDIALLRIKPAQKLVALPIARDRPSKGDAVFAFGAPIGLAGSVSNGIVSALRDGFDISASMKDSYAALGYDMDANWLQTTAPISHGNSGGPLINKSGESVGINTWFRPDGQNLNFAVSTIYVQRMLEDSSGTVRPFTELPQARSAEKPATTAEGEATLKYWNALGKFKMILESETGSPFGGFFKTPVSTYRQYAKDVRALEIEGVDRALLTLATLDAQNSDRIATALDASDRDELRVRNEVNTRINEEYGFLRIQLSAKYRVKFPPIFAQNNDAADRPHSRSKKSVVPATLVDAETRASQKLDVARKILKVNKQAAAQSWLKKVIADFPETKAAKQAQSLLDKLEAEE